jgi:hypothetical protein
MDGVAHPHVQMLANRVAHCREQLTRCAPRDRFQCEHALEQALWALKDYIACPDPDLDKERAQIKKAMKAAALSASEDGATFDLLRRANAL